MSERTRELGEALRRQREAIIALDTDALLDASSDVLRRLAGLRECSATLSDDELTELRAAQSALRVNASILNSANAANVRGLSALLDSPALYGATGTASTARRSRPLDAA